MERAPEMVVAILGALKAGSAWLPLDPTYPKDRTAFILAESRAPLVLTQERAAARLPAFRGPVLPLAVPGAAFSPGSRICNLVNAPGLTVIEGLVLVVTAA